MKYVDMRTGKEVEAVKFKKGMEDGYLTFPKFPDRFSEPRTMTKKQYKEDDGIVSIKGYYIKTSKGRTKVTSNHYVITKANGQREVMSSKQFLKSYTSKKLAEHNSFSDDDLIAKMKKILESNVQPRFKVKEMLTLIEQYE